MLPQWAQVLVALATPATVVVSFLTYRLSSKKTSRDDLRQTAQFYHDRWQEEANENDKLRISVDKLRGEIETLNQTVKSLKKDIKRLKVRR